jgi:arylsulfatase A-like enzyme
MPCTTRRDQFPTYGGPAGTTPFLDEFARTGVLFEDAIAAAPWTMAGATAMLTGHHAVSVGMVEPEPQISQRVLPSEVVTLAEHLHDRGYQTFGATANPNLEPAHGFDQGFDWYQGDLVGRLGSATKRLAGRTVVEAALEQLEAWIDQDGEGPFYLQLMLIETHAPLMPDRDEVAPWRERGVPEGVARYRKALHDLDEVLRYLDERLRALGHDESDTVLVVVGDHGEGLRWPPHHGASHGRLLYPSQIAVPWLMRGPRVAVGHRVGGLASQVDVMPTVLAVAGIPLEQGDLPGRDWSAQVRGRSDRTTRERAWVDTWFREVRRAAVLTDQLHCQRDFGTDHAASQSRAPEFVEGCFDRAADPYYTTPIDAPELMAELVEWRAAREQEREAQDASDHAPDAGLTERLRALGYVE